MPLIIKRLIGQKVHLVGLTCKSPNNNNKNKNKKWPKIFYLQFALVEGDCVSAGSGCVIFIAFLGSQFDTSNPT